MTTFDAVTTNCGPGHRRLAAGGRVLALLTLGAFTGCASNVPLEIREPVADAPSVADAGRLPDQFEGRAVRWGGTIVAVHNEAQDTLVELLARDLGSSGRPRETDASQGRFLVRVKGFLDPGIYARDRDVTVRGTIVGREQRLIGERPYLYPVVEADTVYLWPEYESYYVRPGPYYDPFFPGWYPYRYGWPRYRPYFPPYGWW